jgi:hypothetical protein
MSRKKTILVVSLFCLAAALVVTALWINPQSRAGVGDKDYIWGWVTYEAPANRTDDDVAVLYNDEKDSIEHWVLISPRGSGYRYRGLHPSSGQEGWYWVRGEGPKANSGFYHVYFDPQLDIRQDIYMSPHEPDK